MGRHRTVRWAPAVVLAIAVALLGSPAAALGDSSRPTADPAAPTPTSPWLTPPPQGSAPDGSTVGGGQLDTRGVVVAHGAPPLPGGVGAASWVVADADTGAVLAARDPHGRYYPASTLKTLTLLTLAPRLPAGLVVQGTAEDENIEGSRVGIVRGGSYPVRLLFDALILQSGNDAANALARAAGGTAATVAAMNDTAQRIGAYDTVAGTPSGLDVAGQSSSAYDLALIFRQLIDDPVTAAVLRTPTAQMPPVGDRPGFQIQSQNPLLTGCPGDLGGKTGFTDAARHTFVTAAARGGRRLVVSLMQTERRPVSESDQAVRLLDWGFSVAAGTTGAGRLVRPGEVPATPPATTTAGSGTGPATAAGAAAAAAAHAEPVTAWVLGGAAVLVAVVLVAVVLVAVSVLRRRISAGAAGPGRSPPSPPALPRPATPPPPGWGPTAGAPPSAAAER